MSNQDQFDRDQQDFVKDLSRSIQTKGMILIYRKEIPMKEKYRSKTKRSLKDRFKTKSPTSSQSVSEKEIGPEELAALLKQTKLEEDRLEDFVFLAHEHKPNDSTYTETAEVLDDQLENRIEEEQAQSDLNASDTSQNTFDSSDLESSKLDSTTQKQQLNSVTLDPLDPDLADQVSKRKEEARNLQDQQDRSSELNKKTNREEQLIQDLEAEIHLNDQILSIQAKQRLDSDFEQISKKKQSRNVANPTSSSIDSLNQSNEINLSNTSNQLTDIDSSNAGSDSLEDKQNEEIRSKESIQSVWIRNHEKEANNNLDQVQDLQQLKNSSRSDQMDLFANTNKRDQNQSLSDAHKHRANHQSEYFDQDQQRDIKEHQEQGSLIHPSSFDDEQHQQEQIGHIDRMNVNKPIEPIESIQVDHSTPKRNQKRASTNSKGRHLEQKIRFYLHQWPTYLILATIVSIVILLIQINALHFFKLSFAGLVLGLGMFVIFLAIFGFYYLRNKITKILSVLLCVLVVMQSIGLQNDLQRVANSIETMSDSQQTTGRTMGIYVPTLIPIPSLEALDGETIGIMSQRDDEGIHAVLTSLADQGIHVQTKSYSSLQQLYKGAKGLAVRAVILNEADARFIEDFAPQTTTTNNELSKVYSLNMPSTPTQKEENQAPTILNLEEDPYTILVSGSNDPLEQNSYRSNFNLLITMNPQTRQVLTTLIPRTLAIPIPCSNEQACLEGMQKERLSMISYNSIDVLKQSLEDYLNIPIDFTIRIDIDQLIQLFDLDPTIRYQEATEVDSYVDVQSKQGEHYNTPQIKQLIGSVQDLAPEDPKQQLTLLRVFKTLLYSQVLPSNKEIGVILETLQQAISTSMNTTQLSQLIKTFLIFPLKMDEYYTILASQSTTQYSPTLTEMLYMSKVDFASLEKIQRAILAIREGTKDNKREVIVDPLLTPSQYEQQQQTLQNQASQGQPQNPIDPAMQDQQQESMNQAIQEQPNLEQPIPQPEPITPEQQDPVEPTE